MDNNYLATLKELLNVYKKNVLIDTEIITPELAKKYLLSNLKIKDGATIKNRTRNKQNQTKITRDIKNHKWEFGTNTLKFDYLGNFIDGQHTCYGVIEADTPIISIVIRGLSPDCFKVIDQGKQRTPKDVITTLLLPNGTYVEKPKIIAGAINILNNMRKKVEHIDKDYSMTSTELVDLIMDDYKYYVDPISKISKWYSGLKRSIPESHLAAFYYFNKKTHGLSVDNFMNILCLRKNLSKGDKIPPIISSFREDLTANKARGIGDKKKMTPNIIMKKFDILFHYHLEGILPNMRYFRKTDLNIL